MGTTITPTEHSDCRFMLSTLPHLRQLTIGADITLVHNFAHLDNYSALPTIYRVLATSPPSLTRLTLHCRIHFRGDCNASSLSTIDWQPLVKVLDSSALSVRQTHLHVCVVDNEHLNSAAESIDLTPALYKSVDLSRLVEQGTLVIHTQSKP
jgi:hypothetical protein